jgi:hypothetical protein
MKTTEYIEYTINKLPKGYVFTYSDFTIEVNKKEAAIKALNRMAATGKIVKLARGKYYKSESSIFGKLQPNQYQTVKDLLERNGNLTGYLTGYSIYNKLGLTTQVSNTIQIGKKETRPSFKRGNYTVSFVKQKNNITKENIPLLQILDSMRYIKKLPDTNPYKACERFLSIIKDLSERDKISLVRLAKKYPPSTIALLGAIMEDTGNIVFAKPLRKILNPITNYELSGVNELLSSANKWNIK